jgi:hypothetical protein
MHDRVPSGFPIASAATIRQTLSEQQIRSATEVQATRCLLDVECGALRATPTVARELDSINQRGEAMRQHARVLGIGVALVGIATISATTAGAAPRTIDGAAASKPAGYSIVSATYSLPNGLQTPGSVTCPSKKGSQTVPFSGGALVHTDSLDASINSSYPTAHGWSVDVNNTSGAASQFTVYAVCASKPKGYVQVMSPATSNPAGFESETSTTCPSGDRVTGGGARSSARSTLVALSGLWPESVIEWNLSIDNFSSTNASVTSFAVCAKFASATSYEYLSGAVDSNPAGQETATEAVCSSGLSVLGGGSQSLDSATFVSINSTFPFPGGWIGDVSNTGSNSATVTTFIVCAS